MLGYQGKVAQSFYYLSDLVLAAEAIEQLLEREKTMKWRPQSLQHTAIEDAVQRKMLQLFHQKCLATGEWSQHSIKEDGG